MEFYPSLKHARVRLTGDWKDGAVGEFWQQNKGIDPQSLIPQYGKAILIHLTNQGEDVWTHYSALRRSVAERVAGKNPFLQALRFQEDVFRTALDHLVSIDAGLEYSMDERNGKAFFVAIPQKRSIRAKGPDLAIDDAQNKIGHLQGSKVTVLAIVRDEHSRDERFFIEEHFSEEGFDSRFFRRADE